VKGEYRFAPKCEGGSVKGESRFAPKGENGVIRALRLLRNPIGVASSFRGKKGLKKMESRI